MPAKCYTIGQANGAKETVIFRGNNVTICRRIGANRRQFEGAREFIRFSFFYRTGKQVL